MYKIMRGLRTGLRRLLGLGGTEQSVPDGGVVVDTPGQAEQAGSERAGDEERHTVTDEDGVDRAGTLSGAGFEQIFSALGVPTFILDRDGNVAEWNEAMIALTGVTREEAIGHGHVSELFYHDGRRAATLADKVIEAPESADREYGVERDDADRTRYRDSSTMVNRRGEQVHIEFAATPLYDDAGDLVGVVEVVIDRTENVNERDAIRELVAEIRGTAEAIGGGNLDARASCHESFSHLDAEITGVVDVVNRMASNLDELAGSVDRAGTLSGAGFEQIFSALGVPTFILDRDGNVAEWNGAMIALTGVTREEAIGHGHVSELFYHDGRRAATLADKVIEAPESADREYGVERDDADRTRYRDSSTMVNRRGEQVHIEFAATPLYDDAGDLVGVAEVVIDRTENVNERDAIRELVAEIRETAESIGEGNLDARASCHESFAHFDEEITGVVDVVNRMASNLDELAGSVDRKARELGETVEEATEAANTIAKNVEDQNELLEEGVSEMQSFSAGMEEVAATADQVDDAASAASNAAEEGLDASEDARQATDDVVEIGDELVESVGQLSARMDDIEEVIEVISDVAEQTNLLALNANIEAARAGDGGDGFAIVAEEVKKLADETRGHTDDITASLAELQAQSDETSEAVGRSHDRIKDAGEQIETVLDSLGEIADAVDEAASGVAEVARTTDDQAATVEELTATLESVRERSDRTETAADRIVATTTQQEAAVDELIARVERLDADR